MDPVPSLFMQSMGSVRKIFAIGDIHGCFEKLSRLLERLPYDKNRDLLIFLGDYINRGPNSKKVVSLLCDLKRNGADIIALMGNHEYLLMEYQRHTDPSLIPLLRYMRIDITLESYKLNDLGKLYNLSGLPEEHKDFFFNLRPYYQTDTHIFVHAGLDPGLPLEKQTPETLYEIRDVFLDSEYDFGKTVVFGHSPFHSPLVTRTKIGIDTGAVYGNTLTALELSTMIFYHS
jgi:serine/threonine protein phosphatase 1